ncbi:MAG TPA: succinyl-diaminopimelate desuccinylase [Gammaproteobacteria bacterium]|nr:succinyl-diaminopimelate desuccinylase [Gammaproteobacteria bacterium]
MDTLELARELIRRPSVTPADAGCQELIEGLLRDAGFGVERLRFGPVDNLWARRGRAAPALVFAGHTDVVPAGPAEQWRTEPFAATVENGQLLGRGAADMKGSLAAMVNACRRFAATHPAHAGSLGMLITSDEEGAADDGTLKVMQTLAQRGETFQYCVVGEPSSAERLGDTVRVGRRGSLSGIMTIRGVQGHVAYPLQSDNPIHALAKFVAAITREPIDAGNEHFPPTTFQMVNVHCDAGAPNVVPGELKCRFNFRYSTVWTHAELSARVEALLKQLGISYEIRWRVAGEPFLTKPGKLTAAVQRAIAEETGLTTELSTSGGTSDGRFIAPYGIDVIELGPINKTIHQVNEVVSVEDLDRLERIYFRVAELLLTAPLSDADPRRAPADTRRP